MSDKKPLDKMTKAEALAEADRLFNLALRAEEAGRPEKLIDTAIRNAATHEWAAFDGRA